MQATDILGQQSLIQKFEQNIAENRVPHAQIFHGSALTETLPLALYYSYLLLNKDERVSVSAEP